MSNSDDNEIVLDAHDLCCNCSKDLYFITGDFRDIVNHKTIIIKLTKIVDIVYLGTSTLI